MRRRPLWHRAVGALTLALGLAVVLLNYNEELGGQILPGGHQELYFMGGVMLALSSSWWFGIFDRPP